MVALHPRAGAAGNGAGVGRVHKQVARIAFALSANAWAVSAAGADGLAWNGYLSVASDYMYRGFSLLDDRPSLQGGAEARVDETFVFGAWAGNINRQWLYEHRISDQVEANLYGGVDVGCGASCRARLVVTRYVYSGSESRDWNEATASIALAGRVGASYSYSPRGLGTLNATRTGEIWFVQPLTRSTSLEADGGKLWIGGFDYWFARAGVSHRIDRWMVGVSHYWSDPNYRRFGFDDHSKRFVVSVSTAF
jgi:uncharacterized protein (TIGR02001 family)